MLRLVCATTIRKGNILTETLFVVVLLINIKQCINISMTFTTQTPIHVYPHKYPDVLNAE